MLVEQKFDKYSADYDEARRQLIPCFDEFYGTVMSLVDKLNIHAPRILDLGAGTGLLSRMIAAHMPEASFHLVDISSGMLDVALSHPVFHSRKVKLSKLDLNDVCELEGEYDIVVSSLAIHHLSSLEKEKLFSNVFVLLANGGVFVNADQVLGDTADIEDMYRKEWLKTVRKNGVEEKDLLAALDRMKEDKMDKLSDQLRWLGDARFIDIHCWYKNYSFCVYSASKQKTDGFQ